MAVYSVKEAFYTLQGEGAQAGRAAVFCRFAGCNLWTGREPDRSSAVCRFCDTDFVGTDGDGGGKFDTATALARHLKQLIPDSIHTQLGSNNSRVLVVLTGGEPTLQLDAELIQAMHAEGFEIAIETNGTNLVPHGVDWICVSPKQGAPWLQRSGQELKVVVPQLDQDLKAMEALPFENFFVQPMDDADPVVKANNLRWAIHWCQANPRWRLSVQTHKIIGVR